MKSLCVLFYFISASYTYPQVPSKRVNFSSHRNFNLLSRRGICGIQALQEKVWGGNPTSADEFPWMALLQYRKNGVNTGFQCGGALINDKYVLTAAHCLVGTVKIIYGDPFSVRFGEHNLDTKMDCTVYPDNETVCADKPIDTEIEDRVPHPLYDDSDPNKYNDIGLVRLKTVITFTSFVKPICLPLNNEQSRLGEFLSVAGWGQTERGVRSRVKLKADLPFVPNAKCAQAYLNDAVIADTQLCAGGQEGKDSCNGDSGGPLVKTFPNDTDFYLEGIVSFGLNICGTKNVPGVYTRVNKYIDWVLDNIRP